MRLRHRFTLDGIWSFDAISPDGTRIYLIEYADPTYSVRVYDLAGGLQDGVIVDKREANEQMQGFPVSRVEPSGGGWAYTLYARSGKAPFVHALDTIHGAAYCIDLPWRVAPATAAKLRLRLEGSLLVVRKPGAGRVATVNLQSLRATSIRRP